MRTKDQITKVMEEEVDEGAYGAMEHLKKLEIEVMVDIRDVLLKIEDRMKFKGETGPR